MAKIKYKFNYETLHFETVKVQLNEIIYKKLIPHSALAIVLGVSLFILSTYYIDSPAERNLKIQNNELLLSYDLLNKRLDNAQSVLSEIQNHDDNVYRMIFEAQPIPNSVRRAGFGGTDRYAKLAGFENSKVLINTNKKIDIISKQLVVQSKSFDEIIELVKNKNQMMACIPCIQPIAIKDLERFGSPFGMRKHPILRYYRMHEGIDLTSKKGTNVYASGDGLVMRAEFESTGYGNCIRINHGYGYITLYAHLSKIMVRPGQKIKRGDIIGLVGNTGLSTSSHLHYEVRINNNPVNPVNFYYDDLSDEEYEKMIEMSANANTHIFEK